MNSQQRVSLIFSRSGLTKTNFAKKVDLSLTHIVAAIKGTSTIGVESLRKIAKAHPEYNSDWVVSGFGPMLTDGTLEPSVANSVAQNEAENEAISVKMLDFVMKENAYLKAKLDEALAIIGNQARLSGKLNLQPNAGYAKEVKLISELASVA